jgi:D-alanine-D-alanine ligase
MIDRRLRVGVIFGGVSGEHEVSLQSASSVLANLDPQRYEVFQIGITEEGYWVTGADVIHALKSRRIDQLDRVVLPPVPAWKGMLRINDSGSLDPIDNFLPLDVVFPVLHGTYGEDGTLQGLLEMANIAYVGAGVLGSAVGMDKGVFKDVMRARGIPVLDWCILLRDEIEEQLDQVLERAELTADYPLFVKPANLGSSIGVTKCRHRSDLVEGLIEAARYDRRILVEKGIDGREIEASVLGNADPVVSVPGEVLPSREFYSYEAKYVDGTSGLIIPADLPEVLAERVQQLALEAYKAIDCAGMARVDFLLARTAEPDAEYPDLFINEVNTIPGFTQISMYPKLWEASGLPYARLLDRLIELAVSRKAERDKIERHFIRES